MRRIWYVVISLAIIGGAAALEIWSSSQFPLIEFEPEDLPPLAIGSEREYDYFKNENKAGSYVFWIESKAPYNGRIAYFTGSRTSIEYRYQSIEAFMLYSRGASSSLKT